MISLLYNRTFSLGAEGLVTNLTKKTGPRGFLIDYESEMNPRRKDSKI
jgi:hypothetical protein